MFFLKTSAVPGEQRQQLHRTEQEEIPKIQSETSRNGTRGKDTAGTNWRKRWLGTNARFQSTKKATW